MQTFLCWGSECNKDRRLRKDELERQKDGQHIDYVCPKCGRVIICNDKR